jgi:hypothetical protein
VARANKKRPKTLEFFGILGILFSGPVAMPGGDKATDSAVDAGSFLGSFPELTRFFAAVGSHRFAVYRRQCLRLASIHWERMPSCGDWQAHSDEMVKANSDGGGTVGGEEKRGQALCASIDQAFFGVWSVYEQ